MTFTPHTAVVASLDGGTAGLAQLGEAVARPAETATVGATTTAGNNEPGRAEPLKGHARPALEPQQQMFSLNPRSRYTAEEIIAAYKETGSVWRAGKKLGVGGQTVHERLRALGYRLSNRKWTKAEVEELRLLVANHVPLGQIANRLGRPYAGVACKANELGLKSVRQSPKKIPRGAGYDKVSTLRHMTAVEKYDGKITQYIRAHGLSIEVIVQAFQRHCPERWDAYVAARSDLPHATCEYCETQFIPFNAVQRFCNRFCANNARQDRSYFGGKRRTTIGLAEGVCQLCERKVARGLSSHHVFGKENDPDNDSLIALCAGCHKAVTFLASRTFVDNEAAWESLISLCWMRRHGPEIAAGTTEGNTVYVCVDLDVYMDDDELDPATPTIDTGR